MSKSSVIMIWAAAVLLIGVYFFPLWVIGLEAPQYPDGLGIHIWIDKITGAKPHDLQNINGLNHYIGMRAIEPEGFPELKYMKYIAGFLIGFGMITALARKKTLLVIWVAISIVLAGFGMYDFYKWSYEYGHELDPSAAIKVPGMSYQPPMFGTKRLLNFNATAWPGLGGLAAMIGVALAVLAAIKEVFLRRRGRRVDPGISGASMRAACLLILVPPLLFAACSRAPESIAYGEDQCDYCMMTISDDRYGSALVTQKGRTYKYDSIECMANTLIDAEKIKREEVDVLLVTDYLRRGQMISATDAVFLHSKELPSPMGENLTAFATQSAAEDMHSARGGELLDWDGVVAHLTRGGDIGNGSASANHQKVY